MLILSTCAPSRTATPPVEAPVGAPAPAPPTTAFPPTTASPPTTERLPRPRSIPADSYASEPVVEIGSIEIPAIGLEHSLFQGVTLHNIDRGPSHWTGTAMPGERGNAVFAGHRVTNSHPFLRIDELAAGDQAVFHVGDRRSVYEVTGNLIVTPADTWIADQTPDFTATLYACHPPGSVDQRYVVRMRLVSTGPEPAPGSSA